MSSQNLIDNLHNYTVTVMKNSNPYTTKEAVAWRILQDCADILKIDLNRCIDKKIMYIHPDNMDRIDSKWNSFIENNEKISHDEHNAYKLIKASDYPNILDVQKFISILVSKNSVKGEKFLNDNFLYELLAVDGFQGYDVKNYIENLRIGKGNGHVQIIREVYKKYNATVPMIHLALLNIYEQFAKDDEVIQIVQNTKKELNCIDDVSDIVTFYENEVENLETVAMTKLAQLVTKKKNKKRSSTVLKQDHTERKTKKSKVLPIEDD